MVYQLQFVDSCWLALLDRERNNFIRLLKLKHIILLYLQIFDAQKTIYLIISTFYTSLASQQTNSGRVRDQPGLPVHEASLT